MRYMYPYVVLVFFLSLLSLTPPASCQDPKKIRVAFLWYGKIDDFAFNYKSEVARYEALIQLNKDTDIKNYFGGDDFEIEGVYYEDMVNGSLTLQTIDNEIRDYNTTLFITNTGAHTCTFCEASTLYKNNGFLSLQNCNACPVNKSGDNYAFITIRYTIGRYLSGSSCGHHALVNNYTKIGFVTPRQSGYLGITHTNTFYYGARDANPQVEFYVIETEKYYDPIVGSEAADLLIESGVQCIGSIEDSNIVQKKFTENGLWSTGYLSDLRYSLGEKILYSMIYPDNEIYFTYIKDFILAGNKFPENMTSNIDAPGYPKESGFSNDLPFSSRKNISEIYYEFINEERDSICGDDLKDSIYNGLETYPIGGVNCLKNKEETKVLGYSKEITNIRKINRVLHEIYFSINVTVGKVFVVLIILGLIINGVFLLDIILYRETEVYNAASVVFCLIILGSLILGHVGLAVWYTKPSAVTCNIKMWIAVISIGLVHSALIFKNWRIMKIFNTMSLEVFKISNRDLLLKMVAPYIGGLLVILILWTSLDIFQLKEFNSDQRDYLAINEIEFSCGSKTLYGISATLIYTVLLLIIGCVVAYKTKGVKKKNYKEAESTAWITYNTLLIMVIAVLIQVILSSNVSVVVTDSIIFFAIWFVLVTDSLLLFLPKYYRIHVRGKTTLSTNDNTLSTKSSIGLKKMSSKVSSEAD